MYPHLLPDGDELPDALAQALSHEVVIEDAGRAGVRDDVAVPGVQVLRGEGPVIQCGPCREMSYLSMQPLDASVASMQVSGGKLSAEEPPAHSVPTDIAAVTELGGQGRAVPEHAILWNTASVMRVRRQIPVSWFSMKLTARDGHIPRSPGGRPWLSMSRQYSPLPMASCSMPARQQGALLPWRLAS